MLAETFVEDSRKGSTHMRKGWICFVGRDGEL